MKYTNVWFKKEYDARKNNPFFRTRGTYRRYPASEPGKEPGCA
jgi:hypothetical protein